MVREIDSLQLQQMLGSENEPVLLDIRGANELMGGMLPNSLHLPMHILPLRISEFPKDKDIVLYCRSGARSHTACSFLMQHGYNNVINLRGGIISWAQNGLELTFPPQVSNG